MSECHRTSKKWVMPQWMRRYEPFIVKPGGHFDRLWFFATKRQAESFCRQYRPGWIPTRIVATWEQ